MIEAVITLRKGSTILVVANNWEELSEHLDKMDVTAVEARRILSSELRQGKYAVLRKDV